MKTPPVADETRPAPDSDFQHTIAHNDPQTNRSSQSSIYLHYPEPDVESLREDSRPGERGDAPGPRGTNADAVDPHHFECV